MRTDSREPGDDRISYRRRVTRGDCLGFLVANGDSVAIVEEVITGTCTSADACDDYLRAKESPAPDVQWPNGG